MSSHLIVLGSINLFVYGSFSPPKGSLFTVLLLCSWPLPRPPPWEAFELSDKSGKRLLKVVECKKLWWIYCQLHFHGCHVSLNNREIFPLMDIGGCLPNENLQRQTAMCLHLLTEMKQSCLATDKWLRSSHIQMYLSVINLFGF